MKGQSSAEYLLTYGWAVILIALFLLVLYSMGFFSPQKFFTGTNQAYGLGAFALTDFKIIPNGTITLYLINNAGANATITSIAIAGSNLTSLNPSLPRTVAPGSNLTISGASSITGQVGDAFTGVKIQILFDLQGGASGHIDSGVLSGRIDPPS